MEIIENILFAILNDKTILLHSFLIHYRQETLNVLDHIHSRNPSSSRENFNHRKSPPTLLNSPENKSTSLVWIKKIYNKNCQSLDSAHSPSHQRTHIGRSTAKSSTNQAHRIQQSPDKKRRRRTLLLEWCFWQCRETTGGLFIARTRLAINHVVIYHMANHSTPQIAVRLRGLVLSLGCWTDRHGMALEECIYHGKLLFCIYFPFGGFGLVLMANF